MIHKGTIKASICTLFPHRLWNLLLLLLFVSSFTHAQPVLDIAPGKEVYTVTDYAGSLSRNQKLKLFENLKSNGNILPADSTGRHAAGKWLYFPIHNSCPDSLRLYLSIAFSDYSMLYISGNGNTLVKESGDLLPLNRRDVPNGQLCLSSFSIPQGKTLECYLYVESRSAISRQFRKFTLNSLKLYTEKGYTERFEKPRIFLSFFYGALTIMLVFNLFIFLSTRSRSYFYYILFLFFLGVFLASNNGFIFELLLADFPRPDLYIRFVSAPVLIITYILFSKHYLGSGVSSPLYNRICNLLIGLLATSILAMIFNFWLIGRTAVIILSIIGFITLVGMALHARKRKYITANYYLIGNIFMIGGGILFAMERFSVVPQNPTTQYGLQLGILLEIALFSLGLADRINTIQKELADTRLEGARREKEREAERKKIIEQKNKELESSNQQLDAFIYKTAHDVRGPIATVLGLCKLALRDVEDGKALDYFEKLNLSANALNSILRRLSTAYEISKMEIRKEPLEIQKIVDEVMSGLQQEEYCKNTYYAVRIDPDIEYASDIKIFRFILENLIQNASKFRASPDIAHEVYLNVIKSRNGIEILIEDTGVGIPENETGIIFDLFSRAAKKYQAPGLGLYMVRNCVEKIGGNIRLQKNKDRTTFKVDLYN